MMAKAVAEGVKTIQGVDVEVLKLGKPFSLSSLVEANAIIIGSPTIYGSVTPEMKTFLDSIQELKEHMNLSGKVGGVFGSYQWDREGAINRLSSYLERLDIQIVTAPVTLEHALHEEAQMDDDAIRKCFELGRAVAEHCQS